MIKKAKWRTEIKKSQYRKIVKAKKWLIPKSRYKPKRPRPLELRT